MRPASAASKSFWNTSKKSSLPRLYQGLSCVKANNSLFPVYRILLYLIVGWMLGCERLFHFRKLQHDSLLKRFLGGRCPHHSLLYKELVRLASRARTCDGSADAQSGSHSALSAFTNSSWIWTPPWKPYMAIRPARLKARTRISPAGRAIILCWPLKDNPVCA